MTGEGALREEYARILESQTVLWQGQETGLRALETVYADPERRTRERSWRLATKRALQDRETIGDLWTGLVRARYRQAVEAGFPDYRSYRWQQLGRADYAPEDCLRLHHAIEEWVAPVVVRRHEERRVRLGLRRLQPWDLQVDPPTLLPEHSQAAATGSTAGSPMERTDPPPEFAGIPAMILELQALSYPEAGSSSASADRIHRILLRLPAAAMTDAFEHWAYAHVEEAADPATCGRQWRSVWLRFLPSVDWSGLDHALEADWQRYSSLFLSPFRSIEHALGLLGAIQIWGVTQHDPAPATAHYRRALSVGSQSLPDLYAAAGAHFAFDEHTIREAVDAIEDAL
jgi:oligoendopeptidase F